MLVALHAPILIGSHNPVGKILTIDKLLQLHALLLLFCVFTVYVNQILLRLWISRYVVLPPNPLQRNIPKIALAPVHGVFALPRALKLTE